MSKNILCFFALCFLAANAQTDSATKTPSVQQATTTGSPKVTPKHISDLYIGDLLRTKPKEILEVAESVHQPSIANHGFLGSVHSNHKPEIRSFNYKAHGGHEYAETERVPPVPERRNNMARSAKRIGPSAGVVPVVGHLLTVKPVRVVRKDTSPSARNSGTYQKTPHYANDDCNKNGERSHSGEDKSYVPEERSYHRAKQFASSDPEYSSPQSSYDEDDRSEDGYSSHSDPTSGSYNSKTYPSDTNSKSHSSGSYTQSKSTSSSRTVTPNRSKLRARIIPTTVAYTEKYEKDSGPPHGSNQGAVVYKAKEPLSQGHSSYTENAGEEHPPPNYDTDHKTSISDSPYSQYPLEEKKPKTHSNRRKVYSTNAGQESERPQQYGPVAYEQDHHSYDQSSYSPPRGHQYKDQHKLSNSYNKEHEYTSRPSLRGQEQPSTQHQNYQGPESARQYESEPKKPLLRKRQRSPPYERITKDGGEDLRYRDRQPRTQVYSYPSEKHIQSSRSINESPRESYVPQTKSISPSLTYEGGQPNLRPSEEKEMRQYVYEATPYEMNNKQDLISHKRQYRESTRSARSPGRYLKPVIIEARQLAAVENQPLIMVSRESKPYVSHSVSYSRSGYNADENLKPKSQTEGNSKTQSRQSALFDMELPSPYKPYNSEYPASYANDPIHSLKQQFQSQFQNYDQRQPFGQPHSYEEPQSYDQSGQQPYDQSGQQLYDQSGQQPHDQSEQQSHDQSGQQQYDQSGHQEGSYEQDEAPAKTNKGHHYVSKVEGYRDEYQGSLPLHLDDAFFEKYGISKNAKIIVAHEMQPNLMVADGTKVSEGGYTDERPGPVEEERFEPPNFKEDFKDDSYSESPEPLGAPKEIPGSFDDLVHTNAKFLRKLPLIMDPADSFFKMVESADSSFDENEFRNVEQKGLVVSQGPREIVQQHGDGVSRILFNVPKNEGMSSEQEERSEENRRNDNGKFLAAATSVLKNIIKSDS